MIEGGVPKCRRRRKRTVSSREHLGNIWIHRAFVATVLHPSTFRWRRPSVGGLGKVGYARSGKQSFTTGVGGGGERRRVAWWGGGGEKRRPEERRSRESPGRRRSLEIHRGWRKRLGLEYRWCVVKPASVILISHLDKIILSFFF